MAEIKQNITPVKRDYVCDECGEGNMRPTGMALTSHPVQYPHVCDKCGASQTFYVNYPYIDFE